MNVKRSFLICLMVLLAIILIFPGCSETNAPTTTEPQTSQPTIPPETQTTQSPANTPASTTSSGAPSQPMQAKLSFSEPPILGKPVNLIATLTILQKSPIDKADNSSIEITLPEGFELVSGNLKGIINVSKANPAKYQVTIKSVKTGDWKVEAKVIYSSPGSGGNIGVALASIFTRIKQDNAEISDTSFPTPGIPRGTQLPNPPTNIPSPPTKPGDIAPQPTPTTSSTNASF